MQLKRTNPSPTEVVLTISADNEMLSQTKLAILRRLAKRVSLPGFRAGKAPLEMIEKQIDSTVLQSEFLDEMLNKLYINALKQESLRPVSEPRVTIKKFVPFSDLEVEISIGIIGEIKLADYKKLSIEPKHTPVDDAQLNEVLENLRTRAATKQDVERAAENGDQVWIDFEGVDSKGEPIAGADGRDYPLLLGSNTFIKGFEPEIVGLKADDEKTFTVTFPKDYGVKSLQASKVTFTVKVKKVQSVTKPELNDEFAKNAGPFTSLEQLKKDVLEQLAIEQANRDRTETENELVEQLVAKSNVEIPEKLTEKQTESMLTNLKQQLTYRGQTWQEHLAETGLDEAAYIDKEIKPEAEKRLKIGIILSEVAEKESLSVGEQELNARLSQLKQQYKSDAEMQSELDKPETKQEIGSRILAEKTVAHLMNLAASKDKA